MCRMYGFLATEPTRLDRSLVLAQNALQTQSDRDQRGIRNADGSGIAHWDQLGPTFLKPSHHERTKKGSLTKQASRNARLGPPKKRPPAKSPASRHSLR
jgi:hypothetical protein